MAESTPAQEPVEAAEAPAIVHTQEEKPALQQENSVSLEENIPSQEEKPSPQEENGNSQKESPPAQGDNCPSQKEKNPSELFAHAVVSTVTEDITQLEDILSKIKEEQESLLKEVAEIGAGMEMGNVLEDTQLKQTMMQLPFYTSKLQIIRREMVTLVEKSRKMRERSSKLEERHRAQELAAEQKKAKELAQQEQLLARPASHLQQKIAKK